jgi:DNA mismatch repair protein MutS
VLDQLEAGERERGGPIVDDLPLFRARAPAPAAAPGGLTQVEARLAKVSPDDLTARDALELIYHLRALLDEDSGLRSTGSSSPDLREFR